jgi:hypothetical protein
MPSSEKKGRRLTPPPAFCPLPRVLYRYPATIPVKLPDAISRLLRTRLAFAQYLLQSRHRGAYEGYKIICDGFDP